MHSEAQLAIFTTGWCAARKSIRCTAVTTGQRRHTISRELILEAVDSTTNLYTKLANIVLDKDSEIITLEDAAYNPIVDSQPYFDQVQESFQLVPPLRQPQADGYRARQNAG